jgi:hypothetical protein
MTDLDAGRELDEKVARLVWGDHWQGQWPIELPWFSRIPNAGLLLLNTLAERGWGWQITRYLDVQYRYGVVLNPRGNVTDGGVSVVSVCWPTLPLAICRAVVAALGGEQ